MATSQQQMRHGSQPLLVAVALALVLFVGSADAWEYEKCKHGYKNCNKYKPGCETNVLSDIKNCGYCGKECKRADYADVKCYDGYCKYTCKYGWANCDKKWYNGCEVDTKNDAYNCGSCYNACHQVKNAVTSCVHGKCCDPVCKKGWGNCDKKWYNGCEKDLTHDVQNCGECHKKCPCTLKGGEPTCSKGKCGEKCKKGTMYDKNKNCCVPEPKY